MSARGDGLEQIYPSMAQHGSEGDPANGNHFDHSESEAGYRGSSSVPRAGPASLNPSSGPVSGGSLKVVKHAFEESCKTLLKAPSSGASLLQMMPHMPHSGHSMAKPGSRGSSNGRAKGHGLNRAKSFKSVTPNGQNEQDGPVIDPTLLQSLQTKFKDSLSFPDAQSIKNVYATFMYQVGEQARTNRMQSINSMDADDDGANQIADLSALQSPASPSSRKGSVVTIREGFLRYQGVEGVLSFFGLIEERPEELTKRMNQISAQQAKERGRPRPKRTENPGLDFEGVLMLIEDISSGRKVRISNPLIPIDPDKMPKQAWDCFIMALLFYTCFAVPYLLAFDTPPPNLMNIPYNVFDVVLDCIFMSDMVVSFLTAYYVEGVFVTKLRKIAINYLSTWFFLDLAGSFPFDKVILSVSGNGVDLASLRILKAVRMLKLIRAVKFMDHLNRLQEKPGFGAFKANLQIFKCVFLLVFVSHLMGCIFTLLIDKEGPNWLEAYDPELVNAPNEERYLVALYWSIISISTMGYGDVLPITSQEKVLAVLAAIAGAVIFSYCMGTITSLITQVMGADAKFDAMLTGMDEWLDYRRVPQRTKMMVRRHMYGTVRKGAFLFGDFDNLAVLTPHLRSLVMAEIAEASSITLNLFRGLSMKEKGAILICMETEHYEQDDVIYTKGDRGDRLYGVISGNVKLHHGKVPLTQMGKITHPDNGDQSDDIDDQTTVSQGHTFGELCLFQNLARFRSETAICISEVKVTTLRREAFEKLSEVNPLLAARIRKYLELLALQKGDRVPIQEGQAVLKIRESALDTALKNAFETVAMTKVSSLHLEPCAHEFSFSAWRRRETSKEEVIPEDAYYTSVLEAWGEMHALVKDVFVVRQDGELLVWEGTKEGMRAEKPTSLGHLCGAIYEEPSADTQITQTGRPLVMTKTVHELKLFLSGQSGGKESHGRPVEVYVLVDRKHIDKTLQNLMRFKDGLGLRMDNMEGGADVSMSAEDFGSGVEMADMAPKRRIRGFSDEEQRRATLEGQVHQLQERMLGMDMKMDKILGLLSEWGDAVGTA